MKIGIFVAWIGRKAGGPETYEYFLLKSLAEQDKENEYHIFCLDKRVVDILRIQQDNFIFHVLWPSSRWISIPISLPISLLINKVDFYHATFMSAPYSLTKSIFTMHDVSPFTHPEFYPQNVLRRLVPTLKRGLLKSERIICISKNSRKTTADYFNITPDKIDVVYHGVNPDLKTIDKSIARQIVKEQYNIQSPYILYLGKIEERKNIARLIEAYSFFKQEVNEDVKLVLAGRRHLDRQDITATIKRLGLEQDVIELGYITDEYLSELYSAAEMFVFPSLWEGFGIPILEAMACGTPVITSDVSCLPEIASDAAKLVDPLSTKSIAQSMCQIMQNASVKEKMIKDGYERIKNFKWKNTAIDTINVYQKVYESR